VQIPSILAFRRAGRSKRRFSPRLGSPLWAVVFGVLIADRAGNRDRYLSGKGTLATGRSDPCPSFCSSIGMIDGQSRTGKEQPLEPLNTFKEITLLQCPQMGGIVSILRKINLQGESMGGGTRGTRHDIWADKITDCFQL
jgi:hypothetical protein